MKQPDETKIEKRNTDDIKSASTEKKRKRPTEKPRKRKPPFRSPDTAEQHTVNTIRVGNRLGETSFRFRILSYETFERDCAGALGISEKELTARIKKGIKGKHRSTVHRWYQAGKADYHLAITPCELNCSCHETLRTKVEAEHHKTVLADALKQTGSYKEIEAKDILKIATDHGYLKTKPEEEPESDEELDAGNDAESTDEPWVDDTTDQGETKKGKDDKKILIEKISHGIPASVKPAYKAITSNPKNIPVVKRYLEICHKNHDLATQVNKLSEKDRWMLVGKLEQLA